MSHIFISCNHKDIELARSLGQEIKERTNFDIWLYKKRLRGGDNWIPEIDKAIEEADALVLVLTQAANQSLYVTYEWGLALGLGKPVIPLIFEEIPKNELHDKLSSLSHEDFISNPDWGKFIDTLEQKIAATKRYTMRPPREAPHVIHEIAKLADSSNKEEREDGLNQLVSMQNSSEFVVPLLLQALDSPLPDVRRKAIGKLQEAHDSRAIPHLLKMLHDPEPFIRTDAITALGNIGAGSSEIVDLFLERLDTLNPKEQQYTLSALGRLKDPRSIPKIMDALSVADLDDDFDTIGIRNAAQRALTDYGKSIIPLVKETCLSSNDEVLHEALTSVIASICFVNTDGRHLTRSRKVEVAELRELGFETLRELAGLCPAVHRTIEKWFTNPRNEYHKIAKDALEKILFPDNKNDGAITASIPPDPEAAP